MQLQEQESFTIAGPQLEVLGEVETKLPKPLKKRSGAALVLAALALVSVVGIGGAKLKGRYNAVQAIYTTTNAAGQSMANDLSARLDAAANLIRMCGNILGADDAEVTAAQKALDAIGDTGKSYSPAANNALGAAVDAMYQTARNKAGSKAGALSTQYNEFLSRQDLLQREVAADYTPQAERYNRAVQSFPANLLGVLWRAGEVPTLG